MHTHRYVDVHLHPNLIKEVRNNSFFKNELLMTFIQMTLKEDNTQVKLFEYSGVS
ncbi:uncharacterized protein B0P05DRAFT_553392 [Gilbertella persicaria]|uniref:uncharacterized protein n=1 Tax=Gilbertella persicaria TaxID=101096 RepID=UPI00221F3570|nr:uncharacterized protein B0P05DRAFT_553392 [Gilbertella persicaria]KAI8066206.1 hypothetical protein B0P05DRAFT_553392 [Gilbertella persicaria]